MTESSSPSGGGGASIGGGENETNDIVRQAGEIETVEISIYRQHDAGSFFIGFVGKSIADVGQPDASKVGCPDATHIIWEEQDFRRGQFVTRLKTGLRGR